MQTIVERGVGQICDLSQMRPSRRVAQRQTARTARQGQPQQRERIGHASLSAQGPRREREFVQVQIAQNMGDQIRPVFDESRCQFVHLPYKSHHNSSCRGLILALMAGRGDGSPGKSLRFRPIRRAACPSIAEGPRGSRRTTFSAVRSAARLRFLAYALSLFTLSPD